MTSVAYSHDGHFIGTGYDNGKVKVWNSTSGYCCVTFSEHESSVTSVAFSPTNAVFSCSLDGTCRVSVVDEIYYSHCSLLYRRLICLDIGASEHSQLLGLLSFIQFLF